MWSVIGGFFVSLGQLLGIIKKQQELNNTPEMQERKKAEERNKAEQEAENTVQNGSTQEAGKAIS